jgi:hypothetical protein
MFTIDSQNNITIATKLEARIARISKALEGRLSDYDRALLSSDLRDLLGGRFPRNESTLVAKPATRKPKASRAHVTGYTPPGRAALRTPVQTSRGWLPFVYDGAVRQRGAR